MNAFLLVIPLILIRFVLLSILDTKALKRAAFFAPLIGNEKIAYLFYQITNILLLIYPCFLKITSNPSWIFIGLLLYALGIFLCIAAVLGFAQPESNGINRKGMYRISRNPMYGAYFIYFLACVLLTQSFLLLVILLVFQISTHWIIRSEERWCVNKFGKEYKDYMKKVRRYF